MRYLFPTLILGLLLSTGCKDSADATGSGSSSAGTSTLGVQAWYGTDSTDLDPEQTRRNFYIVLDGSGSMASSGCSGSESKSAVAKRAVKEFASRLNPEDNLGLLVFDGDGITERVPLNVNNRKEFNRAVDVSDTRANTPLKDSITLAYEKVKRQAARQLGYGEYHLVVVTDGEANMGQDPSEIVKEILTGTPVVIHTMGFCIGGGHSLNQPGKINYRDANSPGDLKKGLESVLAESDSFKPQK